MKKKRLPSEKSPVSTSIDAKNIDILYQKASAYIDQARHTIHRTIDTEMVRAYWCIGRDIFEEELEAELKREIKAIQNLKNEKSEV